MPGSEQPGRLGRTFLVREFPDVGVLSLGCKHQDGVWGGSSHPEPCLTCEPTSLARSCSFPMVALSRGRREPRSCHHGQSLTARNTAMFFWMHCVASRRVCRQSRELRGPSQPGEGEGKKGCRGGHRGRRKWVCILVEGTRHFKFFKSFLS